MGAGCSRILREEQEEYSHQQEEDHWCQCISPSPSSGASSSSSSSPSIGLDGIGFDYTLPLELDAVAPTPTNRNGRPQHRKAASSIQGPTASVFEMLYGRYLPFVVRDRFLSSHSAGQSVQPRCELECFQAALSFVDISGFTRLSEELVGLHGSNGAEILNEIISGYFKKLIDVIVDFGGESVNIESHLSQHRTEG